MSELVRDTEFVYDLVPEEHRITDEQWRAILASSNAERRAAKVLGKAVHPNALKRLFELWPEAEVHVSHFHDATGDMTAVDIYSHTWDQMTDARDHFPKTATGNAFCAPEDQFNKRYGIQLAFRRALDDVRRIESE
jgi:hypothetical protein